jgi:NADH-quinone oxidoreductase subunit L
MTFHGQERFGHESHDHLEGEHGHDSHESDDHHSDHGHHTPHESPWVVTIPLMALAVPSLFIGWFTIGPVLFEGYFGDAIFVSEHHDVLGHIREEYHGPLAFLTHALTQAPVYLALLGVLAAWFLYIRRPELPGKIAHKFSAIYTLLAKKFYFDEAYQAVFAAGSLNLGNALWRVGDVAIIDGGLVNGSAKAVGWLSGLLRRLQSGYLYHYAFAMIIGLSVLLAWYVLR